MDRFANIIFVVPESGSSLPSDFGDQADVDRMRLAKDDVGVSRPAGVFGLWTVEQGHRLASRANSCFDLSCIRCQCTL